jgi:non-specific serine/threonine protein kinase
MTSFVGRTGALEGVGQRLHASRVVSIVGPGGAGKSRLAIEAADVLSDRYPDGVWISELHSTLSEAGIYGSIAAIFDLTEVPGTSRRDLVASHLRDVEMLLILDNCEHLADQLAVVVHDLVENCPRLRFLATSRERIRMSCEMVWVLEGLAVPTAPIDLPGDLPDSVELFRQRALAVDPGFEITKETAESVGDICRQLDGIPLAIELAAARMNAFSPEEISRRLDDMGKFLTSPHRDVEERHSSLQTVMSWSYGLLSAVEQDTFARLGVFSGGFDHQMAKVIAGSDQEDFEFDETFESLIDKSLMVRMGDASSHRYRLLESLRQHAVGLLDSQGLLEEMRDQHAAEFTALAIEGEPKLRSAEQVDWLVHLEAEHDNFRSALGWLIEKRAVSEAQVLAGCLARFWDLRGHYTEGLHWLKRVVALGLADDPRTVVTVSNGLATLALLNGEIQGSMEACRTAIDAADNCGDLEGKAYALQFLGLAWIYAEDLIAARTALDESVAAAEAALSPLLSGWSGVFLTAVEIFSDDLLSARKTFLEARHFLEEAEEAEGIAWTYVAEGIERWRSDDPEHAAEALQLAMAHFAPLRAGWGVSVAAVLAGLIRLELGEAADAAAILTQSEMLRSSLGAVHLPGIERWLIDGLEEAKRELGESEFAAISEEAAALPAGRIQQMVESVVSELVVRTNLSGAVPAPTRSLEEVVFRREGDVWELHFRDRTSHLRHVNGFNHLAALLSNPGQEIAAVELATAASRGDRDADILLMNGPDHELLDAKAVTAMKARLTELDDEIAESERWSDQERSARSRAEMDAIVDRLAADVGLFGRSRSFVTSAERARVNVTKAIRLGITRVAEAFPELGDHLRASISTGSFCGYRPDPSSTLRWRVVR